MTWDGIEGQSLDKKDFHTQYSLNQYSIMQNRVKVLTIQHSTHQSFFRNRDLNLWNKTAEATGTRLHV